METSGEYSVCVDCYTIQGTGDATGLDYTYGPASEKRLQAIENGFKELTKNGGHLTTGEDLDEFAKSPCECCGCILAGSRHTLLVIKEQNPKQA
tara:strand:+ start:138 stop:419 length:282 start_codon:yes stop_codon:yes gene_type:complete